LPISGPHRPNSDYIFAYRFNGLKKQSYGAATIVCQLKNFVRNFPHLQAGERKLLVDSLIERVKIGQNKRVILTMRSPFASFGYLSPSSAPRGEKPKAVEMRIYLEYDLLVYYNRSLPSTIKVGTMLSRKTYTV
jgi:hypothetical protein